MCILPVLKQVLLNSNLSSGRILKMFHFLRFSRFFGVYPADFMCCSHLAIRQ